MFLVSVPQKRPPGPRHRPAGKAKPRPRPKKEIAGSFVFANTGFWRASVSQWTETASFRQARTTAPQAKENYTKNQQKTCGSVASVKFTGFWRLFVRQRTETATFRQASATEPRRQRKTTPKTSPNKNGKSAQAWEHSQHARKTSIEQRRYNLLSAWLEGGWRS